MYEYGAISLEQGGIYVEFTFCKRFINHLYLYLKTCGDALEASSGLCGEWGWLY